MTQDICYDEYRTWFDEYVRQFHSTDDHFQKNITMKYDHTLHVVEEIADIATSCGLGHDEFQLAKTIALFHDLGRFKQYSIYGTFRDARSRDHANMALEILEDHGLIKDLDESCQNCITTAIYYHNKKEIPSEVSGKERFFSQLIRDADKIDIFRVVIAYYEDQNKEENVTLQMDLPDDDRISEVNIRDVCEERIVNIENLASLNDFKLLQIGWVYDLNFHRSYVIIQERKYIEKIIASLPATVAIGKVETKVLDYLNAKVTRGAGDQD